MAVSISEFPSVGPQRGTQCGVWGKKTSGGEAGSADWLPDTREKMLCNFILTREQMLETREELPETRDELPNTREELPKNRLVGEL